jgi:hypothetical protein
MGGASNFLAIVLAQLAQIGLCSSSSSRLVMVIVIGQLGQA